MRKSTKYVVGVLTTIAALCCLLFASWMLIEEVEGSGEAPLPTEFLGEGLAVDAAFLIHNPISDKFEWVNVVRTDTLMFYLNGGVSAWLVLETYSNGTCDGMMFSSGPDPWCECYEQIRDLILKQ